MRRYYIGGEGAEDVWRPENECCDESLIYFHEFSLLNRKKWLPL